MSHSEDSSILANYHFPPWPSSSLSNRPHSSISSKETNIDVLDLMIDNRSSVDFSIKQKRTISHHVRIPTYSPSSSPRLINPMNSTPDIITTSDEIQKRIQSPLIQIKQVKVMPLKQKPLSIPQMKQKEENLFSSNFPRQTHQQRQITNERRKRKQQSQTSLDHQSESETWFHLRRSLAELKRLEINQKVILDQEDNSQHQQLLTNHFHSDQDLFIQFKENNSQKQNQKQKQTISLKTESDKGTSSLSLVTISSRVNINRSLSTKSNPYRSIKKSTENSSKIYFDPLGVRSKPIHQFNNESNSSLNQHKERLKIRSNQPTISNRIRIKPLSRLSPPSFSKQNKQNFNEDKRRQLLSSDLSMSDRYRSSSTLNRRNPSQISNHRMEIKTNFNHRPQSTLQLSSRKTFQSNEIRCRSATEIKTNYSLMKLNPRFLIIADEEHRIESWFHQYPFILADDLIQLFKLKSPSKPYLSAFFIDEIQSSKTNLKAKTFLQGKSFHIYQDWIKYDLILISTNSYQQIIDDLKIIIRSNKSLNKIIQIYPIDHQEELKLQVKYRCQIYQQEYF